MTLAGRHVHETTGTTISGLLTAGPPMALTLCLSHTGHVLSSLLKVVSARTLQAKATPPFHHKHCVGS